MPVVGYAAANSLTKKRCTDYKIQTRHYIRTTTWENEEMCI